MYRTVLPRCTIFGSVEPVPYCHFLSGAVPNKCQHCKYLFEGSCRRAVDQVQNYLSLDHGPCPINGKTNPILVETQYYKSKVFVPEKCCSCKHLELDRIRGFVCNFERERWGHFPRTLDWGAWTPEQPNIGLESGRSVSLEVLQAVAAKNEVHAIKAFRTSHPEVTLREARDAYSELLAQLEKYGG